MRYLADTHIVLWSWHTPDRLSRAQKAVLDGPDEVIVSIASIWEISIKSSIGKLTTRSCVAEDLIATGFQILPITARHAEAVRALPLIHKDPFDRMLIAQARHEGLTILTADVHFSSYEVDVL